MTDITDEQVIRAGSNSKNKAVQKAFEKLRFALSIAHNQDEIKEMMAESTYHIRISQKNEYDNTYDNLLIRWCSDDFTIYIPQTRASTIGGRANKVGEHDPAIVYLPDKQKDVLKMGGPHDSLFEKNKRNCHGRLER